ncbi:DUF6625 family protein [Mesobacillus selenatarsenatis]|uniref:Uncharacterized protein n=1 Tax=Mesobacillus selenatarsenatis (strain DSM 18680 / JCM 14380 / FERM P-15431 / SF-1) TaxID=1321606 RepID=A0A0A8XDK1_MESS1|nr:DUF6625 family protein [Mesobacillus selenatarsenatis]GAM16241.1 hypothetical protein SAMD00020551_4429 [Mesobacillus selenatarsenatis SF-1]
MKKILIIIPYFGEWPSWFNLYIESCKNNPSIDWLFFTDCDEPENKAENIKYHKITFADYKKIVEEKLLINFNPSNSYKLCDLKPALGYIHEEHLAGYDFFGYGDIDLIYGNIKSIYTDELLSKYEVFSTHENFLSGHFALLKNTQKYREYFKRIKNWKEILESNKHVAFDEFYFGVDLAGRYRILSKILGKQSSIITRLRKLRNSNKRYLFREEYTTPYTRIPWIDGGVWDNHPTEWYWKNGILTNNINGNRQFLYFHFMNWKPNSAHLRGKKPIWEDMDGIVLENYKQYLNGFKINKNGFQVL